MKENRKKKKNLPSVVLGKRMMEDEDPYDR